MKGKYNMNDIINIADLRLSREESEIDLRALRSNTIKVRAGLIAPASDIPEEEIVTEHSAEPIKDLGDIERIINYLISQKRYRDYMLFVVGINFGLRVSDLRLLRFCNLINDNLTFKDTFAVFEKKTRNTRKVKKNRYITVNKAVIEAVTLYLENTPGVKLSDYLFTSQASNNGSREPLTRGSIDRILKGIAYDLDLNIRMSTHTLRKTFGYHQMMMSGNDPRKLLLLSKMFGHSSVAVTLDYIGITDEEIRDAYLGLNLGSSECYIDSQIAESEVGAS